MCAVIEHRGDLTFNMAESLIAHNHDGNAGRSKILLRSGIDYVIFGDIDRTREYIARHVGYKTHIAAIRIIAHLCAVDGIV